MATLSTRRDAAVLRAADMFGTASTASLRHGGPCPNVPVHPDAVFASSLPLIHLHFLAVRLLPSKCEQVFSEYNVKTAEVKAATAQAQGDGGHHLRGSSSSAATV